MSRAGPSASTFSLRATCDQNRRSRTGNNVRLALDAADILTGLNERVKEYEIDASAQIYADLYMTTKYGLEGARSVPDGQGRANADDREEDGRLDNNSRTVVLGVRKRARESGELRMIAAPIAVLNCRLAYSQRVSLSASRSNIAIVTLLTDTTVCVARRRSQLNTADTATRLTLRRLENRLRVIDKGCVPPKYG
uniref:Uncharacterized protein n=1 Tax=Plectus sambesii TaxID=2011161 RepID=A0A914UT14_9BILA